jgi:hypothetical protein
MSGVVKIGDGDKACHGVEFGEEDKDALLLIIFHIERVC